MNRTSETGRVTAPSGSATARRLAGREFWSDSAPSPLSRVIGKQDRREPARRPAAGSAREGGGIGLRKWIVSLDWRRISASIRAVGAPRVEERPVTGTAWR